jgi:cytoskeletal protein CcmA (bactofilin family)
MADPTAQLTIIGADAAFSGEMSFKGVARILGSYEGRIVSNGELQIAEEATCKASIEVARLFLEGSVEGDVTANERLELTPNSRLRGNVVAAKLIVAEGATLIGHVTVGSQMAAAAPAVSAIEAKPLSAPRRTVGTMVTTVPQQPRPEQKPAEPRPDFRTAYRAEVAARR